MKNEMLITIFMITVMVIIYFQQVSDQGGGIPRSLSERMFHYMYSTAPQPSKSDAHTVPLAGKYF